VISERAERASLIISTNLEFSRWVEFFGDPMLTAALVDRVTHRAHILNMNGDSYYGFLCAADKLLSHRIR
jgi:DNA replication protein DnaC